MYQKVMVTVGAFICGLMLVVFPVIAGTFTRAEFKVNVTPSVLTPSVTAQGGVTGNTQVTVRVQRIKRNKVRSCNQIRFVEVLTGRDYKNGDNVLSRQGFSGRGRCFFDVNMIVNPFSTDEFRNACRGIQSGVKRLVKDGIVTSWTGDIVWLHRMWRNGGTGGVPKNQASIRFVAKVNCGGRRITGTPVPPTRTVASACNMSNWWKFTTGVAGIDGEWKFSSNRSTQAQGKYSTRGPATSRNGRLNRGRGTGNATISSNKNFSWTINRNLTCKGRINNSCTVVTGQCRGKGYRAPKYSFRLEKSKGPVDISPKRNPAGNPTGVSTPSGTRSAPRRPGNTFKPRNPHLPPKPRW